MESAVSLRLRITLAFAAGMAAVLLVLGVFVYIRTGAGLLDEVDAGLRSRAEVLAAEIRSGGPDLPDVTATLIESDEAFAQIADPSGEILHSSRIVQATPLLDARSVGSITRAELFDRRIPGIDNVTRVLAAPVPSGERRYVLMVGASLQDRRDELLQLGATLAIAGPVALALISVAGWLLIGAALRPVERMRGEAAAISALEPDRRLPVPPGDDELASLATTLNAMLSRLQVAFDRERRFVDDASHEIRTPLGVLRGRLELALSRSRSREELEDALRRSLAETERLSHLAEDLLVLSRVDGGRVPIHREEVDLSELLKETIAPYRERAEGLGVRLDVAAPDRSASLDPIRVRQALGNLLDNSLRHVRDGGTIDVVVARVDGRIQIRVDDSGEGFPPDVLAVAFEPFTRGPADRTEPGAGLGLAIVRAVAEAHGGGASAENRPDGGASVTLTLEG
jgi:heavy metal sensor kinase